METSVPLPIPGRRAALCSVVALAAATLSACGEPEPVIKTADGSTMILIPSGTYPRGGTEEEVSQVPDNNMLSYYAERPVSDVQISRFYIDKFEVTNDQYRRFLGDAGEGPGRWDHPDQPQAIGHGQRYVTPDLAAGDQPAVGINWYDAYAYCNWADKRLPTEAEWEYAARGSTYRIYPWGDEPPFHDGIYFANYAPAAGAGVDGHKQSAPVGSYPDGVSPFGLMDMAGNAEEWVQDWYDPRYYSRSRGVSDPPGPAQGAQRVIKGGSYGTREWQIRVAKRFKGKPHNKGPRVGFRCARNP